MKSGYKALSEDIKGRINPERILLKRAFSDELASISYSDVLVYIRYAMKGVETEYTQVSKQAGENVKTHLSTLENTEFKFQGSVMTNTHIKAYSDIDLLAISTKFYTWDQAESEKYLGGEYKSNLNSYYINKLEAEKNYSVYQGSAEDDLKEIRLDSETILSKKYKICDINKPKSIKIRNQDLNREVDIVTASWYDDVRSIINDKGENRGIQIYNKQWHIRENADYPFISIKKINDRGNITNGRLKKMIRFIKNIKADSDKDIELSSFDINAICFDIDISKYQYKTFVDLVGVLYTQLKSICTDSNHADNIISVDEREFIFRNNQAKIDNIKKVMTELESIVSDLKKIRQFA